MGHLIYFFILAIVSITGKIAASSHNASRRRPGSEIASEKIELQSLDEKQAIHERIHINRARTPNPQMFRIRRTLLGSITDGVGVLGGKLNEEEDLVSQRRKLKKSLRIVIPDGEFSRIHPGDSDIPSTFNLYAEQCGPGPGRCATSHVPLATARKAPRLRFSYVENDKMRSYFANKTWIHGVSISGDRSSSVAQSDLITTDGFRETPNSRGIHRVGMLKLAEEARSRGPATGLGIMAG